MGLPVKFSGTPGKVAKGAPVFGEDTRAILAQAGFSEDEIAGFQKEGAIVCSEPAGRTEAGKGSPDAARVA
jgi:hypothetical protein